MIPTAACVRVPSLLVLVLVATAAPAWLVAQCANPALPGAGIPGVGGGDEAGYNGPIFASAAWDPDGPGPRAAVLAVGGNFTFAGRVAASSIATFDRASGQWASVGAGLGPAVLGDGTQGQGRAYALQAMPNGDLVVGGRFLGAGSVYAANLARWNGAGWSAIGTGTGFTDGDVYALAILPNGDLVAGGSFSFLDGVACAASPAGTARSGRRSPTASPAPGCRRSWRSRCSPTAT